MSCEKCNGVTELVDSQGGTKEGRFTEKYKCVNCGAVGTIRGEAGKSPQSWKRTGPVFQESL